MQPHWVFNDCPDWLKGKMRAYWDQKLPRLEKLLQHFRADLQHLGFTVYRHDQPQRIEIRAALHLPTGTLVAEGVEEDFTCALDRVADVLVREVKRHLERLRRDHIYRRKTRRREGLATVRPFLERDATAGRRIAFFDLLRPQLDSLRDYARRELRILELEGVLPKGELTPTDLVDEVLVLAWQRFTQRPRRKPLDLWLIDLLEEYLKRRSREPAALSLVAEGTHAGRWEVEEPQDTESHFMHSAEQVGLEDCLPGSEGTEPWERLEAREQRGQLWALLATLPRRQRQILVLHALDGFDLGEIAMIQDRPEPAVAADLEAARQALRSRLAEAGYTEGPSAGRDTTGRG